MRRAERTVSRTGAQGRSADDAAAGKKKVTASAAWREARELVRAHKNRLLLGLLLMLISRLAGLVLPASSKYLVDEVIGKGRHDLLMPIAIAGGIATGIQAITSFLNSQILGVAAQRAITEMRKRVQARLDAEWCAAVAHHERRRGHP
jgi:ABC-type bacteriocin/lantibiotic exporter with double-glycine peptidase domain